LRSPGSSGERLEAEFGGRAADKKQLARAIDAAVTGCVKRHVFVPSGRCVYTVVGSNADEFIDPDKLSCTCESYFYGVLGNKVKRCYHLLSYEIASESDLVRQVSFEDEEYDTFVKLLAADVLRSRELGKSKGTA